MKKVLMMLLVVISCVSLVGCFKPPKVEKFEEVKNNETAFVVQLEGEQQAKLDSLESLKKMQVSVKRIDISQRFRKTGRFGWQGNWIPTVNVIKIDRSPVTREWTADTTSGTSAVDQGIWVESKDSIGFSTGFNATAKVEEQNAAVFLYNYPSGALKDVMDSQIRNEIQAVAAEMAAMYKMDECREKKIEIIAKVREVVIPKFAETGITITTIGMFGGFAYEDTAIQIAINSVFVAQQEKNVALALFEAQKDKNATIEMGAVGLANAAVTKAQGLGDAVEIQAGAEAKAISLVAAALEKAQDNPMFVEIKKLEVETERIKVWDGKYPQWYMGGANGDMGLIVNPPMAKN